MQTLKNIWLNLSEIYEQSERDHVFMLASALAFNIILYQIPLFLMTIFIVDSVIGFESIALELESLLKEFMPPSVEMSSYISSMLTEATKMASHSSIFGVIGIVVLLWLSGSLVSSIRYGLNTIFGLDPTKISVLKRFKDMFLALLFTVLIILYSYFLPVIAMTESLFAGIVPQSLEWLMNNLFVNGTTLLTSLAFFYAVYKFIPDTRVPRRQRIFATVSATVLIELSRHIFAWYLASLSALGKFYGVYVVIVSMALWIYYSSLLMLLSAEGAKYWFSNYYVKRKMKNE
jgi:membrane protein